MDLVGMIINNRYHIIQKTEEDFLTISWKARDKSLKNNVILKFLKNRNAKYRLEDLLRFKKQTAIIANIAHKNIVTIFETGEYNGHTYLVHEFYRGLNLAAYLTHSSRAIEQSKVLNIITQISKALQIAHDNGIIHKNLNQNNIIILPDIAKKELVKITGFGQAELLEYSDIKSKNDIVNMFSYMSPEAGGIITSHIDERSDLYSLGVLFYQLITGRLPFESNEINELLHKHIAARPKLPSQIKKGISQELDNIILKLLNKEQAERYQTAIGLIGDINRLKKGEKGFTPGTEDKKNKLNFNTGLIGRKKELTALKIQFNKACNGEGAICLIKGEAGSGKTRLVEELKGHIFERGGMFLGGKCFTDENKMPYQIFKDVLNDYIDHFHKFPENIQQKEKRRLNRIVGELGEIVNHVNPYMKYILDDIKPLVSLTPEKENERFVTVLSNLFCSLSNPGTPLVIFLDDLHWADEGSLLILKEIAYYIKKYPLYVVGTYRSEEQSEAITLIDRILSMVSASEMSLDLFNTDDLHELTAAIIGVKKDDIPPDFTTYLLRKSKGNSFFALEIIRRLIDEEIIYQGEDHWNIDAHKLESVDIPDSVIDVVLRRIDYLSEKEITLLSYAAIYGFKFNLDMLYHLDGVNQEDVFNSIDKMINLQLLQKDPMEKGRLTFIHDRVREAFYQKLSPEQQQTGHHQIARIIENLHKGETGDIIYNLVHHFIMAGDDDKILEYALPAATYAKINYANSEAIKYYHIALAMLEKKDLHDSEQWKEINIKLSEVYLITCNFDAVIHCCNELMPLMATKKEKALIKKQLYLAYYNKGEFTKSEMYAKQSLKLVGETLHTTKPGIITNIIKESIIHGLHTLFPNVFITKKKKTISDKFLIISEVYYHLNSSYLFTNRLKFIMSSLRFMNFTERKIGTSHKAIFQAWSGYIFLCMVFTRFRRAIKFLGKSLVVSKKNNDQWGIAHSYQIMGYCYLEMGNFHRAIECLKKSITLFNKVGDIIETSYSLRRYGYGNYMLSEYNTATAIFNDYLDLIEKTKEQHGIYQARIYQSRILIEKGNLKEAEYHISKIFEQSLKDEHYLIHYQAGIFSGIVCLEKNEPEKALTYLLAAKDQYEKKKFIKHFSVFLYTHIAEAALSLYTKKTSGKSSHDRKELKKLKKHCITAYKQNKRWPSYRGSALRVLARYYALTGHNKKAHKLFNQSLSHLAEIGMRFELGVTYYHYGAFIKQQFMNNAAKQKLEKAYTIFKEIGAALYLRRTALLLGIAENEETARERFMEKRRLDSVISLSQKMSSILNIETLLDTIIASAIEVTGASRGFLFIYNDNTGQLELRAKRCFEKDILDMENDFMYSTDIINDVFKTGTLFMTNDALHDDTIKKYHDILTANLKSILCVPIEHHDKRRGVFYLDNRLSGSVFTDDDIELLNVFLAQAAISIDNAELYADLEGKVEKRTGELHTANNKLSRINKSLVDRTVELKKARDAIWGEMQLAKKIQTILLPKSPAIPGYHIIGYMSPADDVGGDYYDIINTDYSNWLAIGDVSGHGVPAGLVMMMVHTAIRAILKQTPTITPKDLLSTLNWLIKEKIGNLGDLMYMTICVINITKNHIFTYAGLHLDIMIYRNADDVVECIETEGMWIGIMDDIDTLNKNNTFSMKSGDILLLYTDGIIEATDSRADMFSFEQLQATFHDMCRSHDIEEIKNGLLHKLNGYFCNDDITLLLVKRQ